MRQTAGPGGPRVKPSTPKVTGLVTFSDLMCVGENEVQTRGQERGVGFGAERVCRE